MTAGVVAYRATGRDLLLDAGQAGRVVPAAPARRPARHCWRAARSARPTTWASWSSTGSPATPSTCVWRRRCSTIRDRFDEGSDDNQDRVPLREQTTIAGHAVRANYLYAGAADLVAETGDAELLGVLDRAVGRPRPRSCTSPAAAARCTTGPRRTATPEQSHDHAGPPGVRTCIPAAPDHGPQRVVRRHRAGALGLADAPGDRATDGTPTSSRPCCTTPCPRRSGWTARATSTRTRCARSRACPAPLRRPGDTAIDPGPDPAALGRAPAPGVAELLLLPAEHRQDVGGAPVLRVRGRSPRRLGAPVRRDHGSTSRSGTSS